MSRLLKSGVGIVAVCVVIGGGAGFIFSRRVSIPATAVSLVQTASVTPTETPSPTATDSATPTETPTMTYTPSPTLTFTPTLSTLVLQITAINPDVTIDAPLSTKPPIVTPSPLPTLNLPTPAAEIASMPTGDASPVVGWLRYTADHPAVQQIEKWELFTSTYRSANRRYLYTNEAGAALILHFLGAGVRVRYARLSSYGVFEVRIDGRVATTVDAYLPKSERNGDFVTTEVFALVHGWHTLEIRRLDRRNPDSTDGFIAIDAVDVYENGPAPTTPTTALPIIPTPTPSPALADKIQLLVAPPTIPPTATTAPPQVTGVSLTVAYDLNGNKAVEPGEGVRDLPVQLVRSDTNQVVASGSTDAQGYVHLETTGTAPLRLVVPYFNRFWDVPLRAAGTRITLLLPPANRPALIP
jgi:hypothetical protein